MQKKLKWAIGLLGCFIALSVGYNLYYKAIDGFRLGNVRGAVTYDPAWKVKSTKEQEAQVKALLRQPFTYLGKGGQAYAFESEDGRYVLKLLKFKFLRPKITNRLISFIPFLEDKVTNDLQWRQKKFYELYQGYKWAYQLNKEGSGLIYLHFNPTFNQFGAVTLYDKLGRQHTLELDQVAFIIQEKGRLLDQLLNEKLSSKDIEGAKILLNRFFDAVVFQYNKGLYDRDYGHVHNAGFVANRPIHIDMGKITYDPRMKEKSSQNADLKLILARLDKWLIRYHPQVAGILISSITTHLQQQGLMEKHD